jgi:shikimate dehydrogenase
MKLGVIGSPIEHSRSPEIHYEFAAQFDLNISFEKYLVEKNECIDWVKDFFANKGSGLSVTLPLKEVVLGAADEISERALQAGAANMLHLRGNKIFADCTDGIGLVNDFKNNEIEITNKTILVIGAGGASRGILPSLLNEDPKQVIVANRTPEKSFKLVSEIQETSGLQMKSSILIPSGLSLKGIDFNTFDIVINATSISTSKEQTLDIDKAIFNKASVALDLYYSQSDTLFMKMAKDSNVHTVLDGWGMLVHQAAASFSQWSGFNPKIKEALKSRRD